MNKYIRAHSEVSFLMCFYDMTEVEARRQVLMEELTLVQARKRCKTQGHRLVADDTGGPKSGSMCVSCIRCGFSQNHILY